MSMQSGTYKLTDSGPSVVDSSDTISFHQISFDPPFPEGSKVIVIPALQTFNGVQSPGLRICEVNHLGFKVRTNELVGRKDGHTAVLSDGKHATEKLGWLAMTV